MAISVRKKSKIAIRRAEAWKLYTDGLTQSEIAERIGSTQRTISRDISTALEEFRQERLADIEAFKNTEIASLNSLEQDIRKNIETVSAYLKDRAEGKDAKCSVTPIDLQKWIDQLLKVKAQKARISGIEKETVKVETDTPIEVTLNIRGKKSE